MVFKENEYYYYKDKFNVRPRSLILVITRSWPGAIILYNGRRIVKGKLLTTTEESSFNTTSIFSKSLVKIETNTPIKSLETIEETHPELFI